MLFHSSNKILFFYFFKFRSFNLLPPRFIVELAYFY